MTDSPRTLLNSPPRVQKAQRPFADEIICFNRYLLNEILISEPIGRFDNKTGQGFWRERKVRSNQLSDIWNARAVPGVYFMLTFLDW